MTSLSEAMAILDRYSYKHPSKYTDPGDRDLYGDDDYFLENVNAAAEVGLDCTPQPKASLDREVNGTFENTRVQLEDTKRELEDIRNKINLIKDMERDYFRRARETEACEEQPFMMTEDDFGLKKEKSPEEMTLLEKLSQRSDAGILADKFTNFLKTNSLQK